MTTTLSFVDLFAGCGGGSLGFRAAGFSPVGAVEIDPTAACSYEANIGLEPIVRDIRDVSGRDIMRPAGLRRGELTLLFGCPPCQSFTVLRRSQAPNELDERRNKLPREYLRLVEELLPRHLAFENVPGMADGRGRTEFTFLLRGLTRLGYQAEWAVVDAVDYGVPQRRRRLLVVASRVARPRLPAATHGDGPGSLSQVTVRQAIGDLPPATDPRTELEPDDRDELHRARRHSRIALDRLRALKEGQARADLPDHLQLACHRNHTGHYDIYGRMWWDRPAPTLTSGCTNVTRGRFAHPEADRAITLREALLLQSFPPTATLLGGVESMALQVGNAVPPLLAQQVGMTILEMEAAVSPIRDIEHTQRGSLASPPARPASSRHAGLAVS